MRTHMGWDIFLGNQPSSRTPKGGDTSLPNFGTPIYAERLRATNREVACFNVDNVPTTQRRRGTSALKFLRLLHKPTCTVWWATEFFYRVHHACHIRGGVSWAKIFLCIYVTNGDARSAIANFLVLSTFNSFDTALPSDDVVVNGKNSGKVT